MLINIERQKTLIAKWFEACQRGYSEVADRIWELFRLEMQNEV